MESHGDFVFGMHDNALVAYNISETNRIIDTVLGIQPRVTSSDENAATPEQMVDAMAVRAPHHPALPCLALPCLCLATARARHTPSALPRLGRSH